MCSFSQHTLASPDVMTYRPVQMHKHVTIIISQWLSNAALIVSTSPLNNIVVVWLLPDVLSRSGLDHNPDLQLLCALK